MRAFLVALPMLFLPAAAMAQTPPSWSQEQAPFRIYGDTFYVGTRGLSAILVTSPRGDILIDGAIPQAAPQIAAHIRALGVSPRDIKVILNSHAHSDHAGGLAQLQMLTGAAVMASPWSARVLRAGIVARDDPQFGVITPAQPVANVHVIADGQMVHVGSLTLTAHFTPGHTPGGTSWSWVACEKTVCRNIVYADSLTAASAKGFRFTGAPERQFQHSFAVVRELPCDILLTPHPEVADVMGKLARRNAGAVDAFVDPAACRNLADNAQTTFGKRLAREATEKADARKGSLGR